MPQIQPIDWSATAAWITLAISIIGTIAGPIVTTRMTNKYQLKLRELNIKQSNLEKYVDNRNSAICSFISKTGQCLAISDVDALKELGLVYHNVYAYVPESLWSSLDELYGLIINDDWDKSKLKFLSISHSLAEILKETPQQIP